MPKKDGKETAEEKAIRLTKLAEENKKRRAPGYLDTEGSGRGGGTGFAGVLMSGIISLILAILVVFLLAPTKADFTNLGNQLTSQYTEVADSLVDTNSALTNLQSPVDSKVANLDQRISGLSGLESKVNTALDRIDSKLDSAVSAKLADYEARLAALEEEEEQESEEPSEAVTVDLGYNRYLTFLKESSTLEQTIFLDVENNLNSDMEGVELQLTVHSRGVPIPFKQSLCSVSEGWPLQWEMVHVSSGLVVLRGISPAYSEGLEIRSGDNEGVYLSLTLGVESGNEPESDTKLYIEAECTDFELVD